ncbi:hypothetical protein X770_31655 [Mesorhizobium sp. LSJC269B00]|nr:hypothetical protein X770_31655 [Mesorhizobium sp. LSJC269B00]
MRSKIANFATLLKASMDPDPRAAIDGLPDAGTYELGESTKSHLAIEIISTVTRRRGFYSRRNK